MVRFALPNQSRSDLKPLTVEEQMRIAQSPHHRGRTKAENIVERHEARKNWRRTRYQTPDDPFGPEEGFSESARRAAQWGTRFLDLSDDVANGVAKSTLMTEMYQRRRPMQQSTYMHHFVGYPNAHNLHIQQYRRMNDTRTTVDFRMARMGCESHGRPRLSLATDASSSSPGADPHFLHVPDGNQSAGRPVSGINIPRLRGPSTNRIAVQRHYGINDQAIW